jgi:hypothetical protein
LVVLQQREENKMASKINVREENDCGQCATRTAMEAAARATRKRRKERGSRVAPISLFLRVECS